MRKVKSGFQNNLYYIIFAGLFLLPFSLYAQEFEPVKENMEIIVTGADSIKRIHIRTEQKNIRTESGVNYYWYANNQVNYNFGGYSGRLLHGTYSVFDKTGKLVILGKFKNGAKTGLWKYWNGTGFLIKQEKWKNGKLHGSVQEFDNAGKLIKCSSYQKGLLHGKQFIYLPDTTIIKQFKNGKEIIKKKAPLKEKTKVKSEDSSSKNQKKNLQEKKKRNHSSN
jgi:antitoxin component YwqK of YwqJK toxin-antitoxin module